MEAKNENFGALVGIVQAVREARITGQSILSRGPS